MWSIKVVVETIFIAELFQLNQGMRIGRQKPVFVFIYAVRPLDASIEMWR